MVLNRLVVLNTLMALNKWMVSMLYRSSVKSAIRSADPLLAMVAMTAKKAKVPREKPHHLHDVNDSAKKIEVFARRSENSIG